MLQPRWGFFIGQGLVATELLSRYELMDTRTLSSNILFNRVYLFEVTL